MANAVNQNEQTTENGAQEKDKNGVRADKGSGFFPITDMQFDVLTIMHEKCKALQAYDKYILDAQPCKELSAVLEKIARDDKQHVEELKQFLGKC